MAASSIFFGEHLREQNHNITLEKDTVVLHFLFLYLWKY